MAIADKDQPFRVTTKDGVLRSGHPTMKDAETAAEQTTKTAKDMGLKTTYVATEK